MNFYVTRAELFQLSHRLGWKFVVPTPPLTSSSFRKTELSWKVHSLSAPGDPSQPSWLPKAPSNRCTLHNLGVSLLTGSSGTPPNTDTWGSGMHSLKCKISTPLSLQ